MQILIDIPKDVKNRLAFGVTYEEDIRLLCESIGNYISLTKGHGRLMILSEDKLKENQINFEWSSQKWITEVGISNATVSIIEADKENDNE